MNKILIIILCFVVAIFVTSLFSILTRNLKREQSQEIKQINNLREEIVKLDSVRRSEQQRQIDSMLLGIKVNNDQLNKLDKINIKLRQQNEKLDLLYNSLHVSMPEF